MSGVSRFIPSPAMVVAVVALSVALGGTGYAAGQLTAPGASAAKAKAKKPGDAAQDRALIKRVASTLRGPRGFRGAVGAKGDTGAKGDQGPIGPSNAFQATRDGSATVTVNVPTVVATLTSLPAGSFVITAKTEVHSDANTDVLCTLTAGSDTDTADGFVGPTETAGASFVQMLPMQLVHTFSAPGQAQLTCQRDLSSTVTLTNTRITATQVGTATSRAVTG